MVRNRQQQAYDNDSPSQAGIQQAKGKGKAKETNRAQRKELGPKSQRQCPEAIPTSDEDDEESVGEGVRKKQKIEQRTGRQEDTDRVLATNQAEERSKLTERARPSRNNVSGSKKAQPERQELGEDAQDEDPSVVIVEDSSKKRKRGTSKDGAGVFQEHQSKTYEPRRPPEIVGKPAKMCSNCYMRAVQCTYKRKMKRESLVCDRCARGAKICSNRAEVKGVVLRRTRSQDSNLEPSEDEELTPADRRKVDVIVVRGSSTELENRPEISDRSNLAKRRNNTKRVATDGATTSTSGPDEDSPPPQSPEQTNSAKRSYGKLRRDQEADAEEDTSERSDGVQEGMVMPSPKIRHQQKQNKTAKAPLVETTSIDQHDDDDDDDDHPELFDRATTAAENVTNLHGSEDSGSSSKRVPYIAEKVYDLCSAAERIQEDVEKLQTELSNHSSNIRANRQEIKRVAAQQVTDVEGLDESLIAARQHAADEVAKIYTHLEKKIGALEKAQEATKTQLRRSDNEVQTLRSEKQERSTDRQRLTTEQATAIKRLDESLIAAGERAADEVAKMQTHLEKKIAALKSAHETTKTELQRLSQIMEEHKNSLISEKAYVSADDGEVRDRLDAQSSTLGTIETNLKQLREDLKTCDQRRLADNEEVGKLRARLNNELATLSAQQASNETVVGGLAKGMEEQVSAVGKIRAQFEEQSSQLEANKAEFEQYGSQQAEITKQLREDLASKVGKDLWDKTMGQMDQKIQALELQRTASDKTLEAMSIQHENDVVELKRLNTLQLESAKEIALLRSTLEQRLGVVEKSALGLHNRLDVQGNSPGRLKDMAQVLEEVKSSVNRLTVAIDGKHPPQPISPAHKRIRQLLEDKNIQQVQAVPAPRPTLRCITDKPAGAGLEAGECPSPLTPHPDECPNPGQDLAESVVENAPASDRGIPSRGLAKSVAGSTRAARPAALVAREKLRAGPKDSGQERGVKRRGRR